MAFGFIAVAHYDNASSNSAVVAKPTGTADNDILFALVKNNTDENVTIPSGWVQLGTRRFIASTASWSLYWKLAATEGADYTFGLTTATRLSVSVMTYRDGFDTADPIDVVSDTTYTSNNTTLRAASMTVAATGSPIIFFGGALLGTTISSTPPTAPDTFTEDVDYWETNGRGMRGISSLIWSGSGATGTMDATLSDSLGAKHAFAVALNPAAASSDPEGPLIQGKLLRGGLLLGGVLTR